MTRPDPAIWPDLFVVKQFFDPRVCAAIVAELKGAQCSAATVYGRSASGAVDEGVRKTLRLLPTKETVELVIRRLWECKAAVERHFAVSLRECENPQFLRYRKGDFFVAHQDGNTGLLRLDTELRRVSTAVFLSRESESPEPDAHCGGPLIFTDLRQGPGTGKFRMSAEPGTIVAFRSETTHEVTPLTHGERYSIVSWYR